MIESRLGMTARANIDVPFMPAKKMPKKGTEHCEDKTDTKANRIDVKFHN